VRHLTRRTLLSTIVAPALVRAQATRPRIDWGVQSGDPRPGSALVWSRTDRPSRLMVEWSTREDFQNSTKLTGPAALPESGYTARLELPNLPASAHVYYRAQFVSLADGRTASEPVSGHLRTAPDQSQIRRNIRFAWSGDTVGQGFGINPDWGGPGKGGMLCYETVRSAAPDFFIHSGDTIYADGVVEAEMKLPDGTIWKNLVTEAKSHVAETLDDFRGAYLYNLMDKNVRRFNADVPQIWQWDDHEVMNNWSPGTDLSRDNRYHTKSIHLLAARANRAFLEFAPMAWSTANQNRIYRHIPYGPLLDVFVVDLRSYRGPNTANRQETEGPETAWFGTEQFRWLEEGLKNSRARWKVIACDMPIGLLVPDSDRAEAFANGPGPALGRELEMARLLASLKRNRVRNVVWLTADVHYTAAHRYDPSRARFTDFDPFWEFVSGPIHAGTFGPNALDETFGPEVVFQKSSEGKGLQAPSAGMQFFGEVEIDGKTEAMTVALRNVGGDTLYRQTIPPLR
jgi:alkaline phosphatase D